VCLRSFSWLYWPLGEYDLKLHPKSALILNGTNVDVGLIVSFQPDHLDTQTSAQIRDARLLEAKGLTAESLIFEFSETKSSYSTQLDGLKFGRIHSNLANCQFKSETSIGKASGSSQRPQPPNVYQVATWLTRNKTPTSSSQPFAAFADAFEHIGEDATALRVARSNQELWDKTIDWWNTPLFPRGWSIDSLRATFIDTIPIAFQWGLRIVADHGYRPAKAIYGVLITLAIFWWIFWFQLKVIAFEVEQKGESQHEAALGEETPLVDGQRTIPALSLLPIGFLFLFDRLVPALEIREENYSIGRVYGRVSPFFRFGSKNSSTKNEMERAYELTYLLQKHTVVPLDEEKKERFKRWLIVLRVIGVAWGVFLLAALNALIKH
jgi:hypothetical protein